MMRYPGTIAIPPETVLRLYEEICSEACRNGFNRILLLIAHGGSEAVTDFFQHSLLHRREEQRLGYRVFRLFFAGLRKKMDLGFEPGHDFGGHGGEAETSYVVRFRPELVKLGNLPPADEGPGPYLGKTIPELTYLVDWIRQVPRGYHGAPELATPKTGVTITAAVADECAASSAPSRRSTRTRTGRRNLTPRPSPKGRGEPEGRHLPSGSPLPLGEGRGGEVLPRSTPTGECPHAHVTRRRRP